MEPLTAFILGLAGSMHCAGMCGPIAMALPASDGSGRRRVVGRMLYQIGRMTTYALLGAVIGIGGSAIAVAGFGRALSVTAGSLMIIAAVAQLLWHRSILPAALMQRITSPVRTLLQRSLTRHSYATFFSIGSLNGLLPCGLVTAALIGSAGAGTIMGSALFMFLFGLGTVPMMLGISLGGLALRGRARSVFRVAAPIIAIMVGSVIILRGMALDIPYVSPPAPVEHGKVSCCDEP